MSRRQRRAAAASTAAKEDATADDLPLALPDRSGPKGKSLMDLAAERQEELEAEAARLNRERSKLKTPMKKDDNGIQEKPKVTPAAVAMERDAQSEAIANATIYAVTMTMVHFTLDVLVYHQYAQAMDWPGIRWRVATILPSFAIIVYILHIPSGRESWFRWPRQVLFLLFSCAAGCYLIRTGNEEAYIAVMKRAPPLGTLLIWCFIEMYLPVALVSLLVNGSYLWWNNFTVI